MSRRRRSRPLPVAQPTPRPEESSEADAAVVALQAECAKLAEEELPLWPIGSGLPGAGGSRRGSHKKDERW